MEIMETTVHISGHHVLVPANDSVATSRQRQ